MALRAPGMSMEIHKTGRVSFECCTLRLGSSPREGPALGRHRPATVQYVREQDI